MRKYLELFRQGFDSTVEEKRRIENWPYVGHDVLSGEVVYTVIPKPNYLCFEPLDGNNQLAVVKTAAKYNTQYSFDKETWTEFPIDESNPLNPVFITVDRPIYLKGNNPNGYSNLNTQEGSKIVGLGKYNVSGDITTLLNEEGNVTDLSGCDPGCLNYLFGEGCLMYNSEAIPAIDVVDASKLILPTTELNNFGCYSGMFYSCTSLTAVPELLATTLCSHCYQGMFANCTSLTIAPALPVATLAESCYYRMFEGCTSLTTAPELPATELSTLCYDSMFAYCTSLSQAPELPATVLADYCYDGMFRGCSSLTAAPELPATTLTEHCYDLMFYDCTKLDYIKCLATDISAYLCTFYWVNGVSNNGTFVKHPDMTSWYTGNDGIPEGWEVVDAEI